MHKPFIYFATAFCAIALAGCSQTSTGTQQTTANNLVNNAASVSPSNNATAGPTAKATSKPVSSVATAKPPTSSSMGRSNPLAGVYHPYRLHVVSPLKTVSGTVEIVRHEADHDYHINLKLDSQDASLINSKNVKYEHGDLVVEVIPMDQHDVPIPHVGEHITATGAYVNDADHGWMEMHPAWFINGHGSASYTAAAAAASVQSGLSGNGDTEDEGTGLQTTPSPTTTKTPSSSSSGLALVSFTQHVTPGEYASITVHGVPGTTATIEVDYKSGPSHASGLVPETVGTDGDVTWQWKVGTRTTPGNWPVYVQDASKELTETLDVQ